MYYYNLVSQMRAKEGQVHGLLIHMGQFFKERSSFPKYKTLTLILESSPCDGHVLSREKKTSLHQKKIHSRTYEQTQVSIIPKCNEQLLL